MVEDCEKLLRIDSVGKKFYKISPKLESKVPTAIELKDYDRVTRILRELLEAKIKHDFHHHGKKIDSNFVDFLQSFSNTCYGATSVAITKRLDLFNAMRALSPHSPFIYVMTRMMHVPDTLPYEQLFIDFYSTMWYFLLDQDCLSNNQTAIDLARFTQILNLALEQQGTCLPPSFYSAVERKLHASKLDRSEFTDILLVDIDRSLLYVLDELEKFDIRWKTLDDQLFGESIIPTRLIVNGRDINSQVGKRTSYVAADSTLNALFCAKKLLNTMIIEDKHRAGVIPINLFCDIARRWYESFDSASVEEKDFTSTELNVATPFLTKEQINNCVNYVQYFCTFHSFVLENGFNPTITETIEFLRSPHRGVEVSHYNFVVEYLNTVRLQR